MSASRTSAFLRNAHNSQFANNISTIAKNVSTDVVDTLCQKQQQQQRSSAEEDLNATFLSQGALFSDFDAGMGEFGLDDLEQLDVPSLFDGDGDSFPDAMDALSFGAAAAAPTPGPSVMAPAPAPAANSPFNSLAGRISSGCDDPFSDIFGRVTLHSQQRLLSPRASDGAESASGSIGSFAAVPVKVKREQPRPGSVVSRSKPAGMPSLKTIKISRDSSTAHHEDLDEKDEREYQAKLATASAAGDKALIREIKNGREKKRRARMCSKFQELHDILNVTNDMMARFAGLSVSDEPEETKHGAGKKGSKHKASGAGYEKKTKFKKAQVLNEAVKTIEGLHQTFQQMQAQIDALARENQQLKQQHCDF